MKKAIKELLRVGIKNKADLAVQKRKLSAKHKIGVLKNADVLEFYRRQVKKGESKRLPKLEEILRKRAVRTLSGVAPVAVLVKPFPCPGECAYCPTEKNVPQSYLSNEPAVMRAIRCDYNPYLQAQYRLKALEANGHEPEKIELIVIGGTWSVLPEEYKYWYIWQCFKAANEYEKSKKLKVKSKKYNEKLKIKKLKKGLAKEQKKNETAKYRIIGITLETRPDYVDEKELWQMRELGATRVELGVQAIDDKILKINKRGHGAAQIAAATKILKDFGFKVTYHIMPALPGSTPAKDLKMFKMLFSDERFQPDQLKFYPTVVTAGSLLYKWWKAGKYKPYSDKVLRQLIIDCKKVVPQYVRIVRLIPDIPKESIIAGNRVTNLRQELQKEGAKCECIRCREVKNQKSKIKNQKLGIIKYDASGGEEYFLQYTVKGGNTLYGFCRLRLPHFDALLIKGVGGILNEVALIRELHVYGELVPVSSTSSGQAGKKIQHAGLGKKLMAEAEKIACQNGFKKIAVIAGVGVRGYYKNFGYKLESSYMVKKL